MHYTSWITTFSVTAVAFVPLVQAACTSTYTVVSGDSCTTIPQQNSISSYQLTKLNPSLNCAALSVGQQLCVVDSTYNCQPVYTVVSGDSCSAIASSTGTTLDVLLANNPEVGSSCNIQVGQVLCVATSVVGSTTTTTTTTSATTTTTTSSSTPTPTGCTRFTTVQSGDTCNSIGARMGTSLYWFLQLNPTINPTCSNIVSGSAVCVDSPFVNCSSVYQVKGTEGGCYGIASSLNITVQSILDLNPNVFSNCTNLQANEVLCTAPRTSAPPSTACTRNYTVVAGDTCPIIASRNSLTTAQLSALNSNMTCDGLVPGNTLCSFSPSLQICPSLVVVAGGDTCFSLAQNVSMALQEWQTLNSGLQCNPLQFGSIVCSAEGNATLPQTPSGTNSTTLPLCGIYDKTTYCCTKYSVSADLLDPLCSRTNGCQDNCVGDPGVPTLTNKPTPTFTLTPTLYPTPPPPVSNCGNCTSTQCCDLTGQCVEGLSSWYCKSANGCTNNCDLGVPAGHWDLPSQQMFDSPNYTFPSGNYSASGGNPCGQCNATTAGIASSSGQYCCSNSIRCLPQDFADCTVFAGCLFNCIDFILTNQTTCDMLGVCDATTTTVMQPFASPT